MPDDPNALLWQQVATLKRSFDRGVVVPTHAESVMAEVRAAIINGIDLEDLRRYIRFVNRSARKRSQAGWARCCVCFEVKPPEMFERRYGTAQRSQCAKCKAAYSREWYRAKGKINRKLGRWAS